MRLGVRINSDLPGLLERVIALVTSCDVDSTKYAATEAAWQEGQAAHSLVHVTFVTPRDIAFERGELSVSEILVPLPYWRYTEHIFVRSDDGTLHSRTFYQPGPWRDLVFGEPFNFGDVRPYDKLRELPAT